MLPIPWAEIAPVIACDRSWLPTLFAEAYTHHFLRDAQGRNLTVSPRRVVLFGQAVVVLTVHQHTLHVASVGPCPHTFSGPVLPTSPRPTPPDLCELLVAQHFVVQRPDCLSFTFYGTAYTCTFSADYLTWHLTPLAPPTF